MWFDALVLGILIYATIRGAMKGFVWQLATISALVLCFLFAKTISASIAPSIPLQEPLNRWVSMMVLYFFFSFLCFTAARQLKDWIDKAKFTEYDRHLGGIFGFVKGAALCLVMTFFLVTLSENLREQILQTRSGYFAAVVMDRLHPIMPEEVHAMLEPYIHKLDRDGLDLHAHQDDPTHDHDHSEDHDDRPLPYPNPNPSPPDDSLPYFDNDVWGIVMNLLQTVPPQQREELQKKLMELSPTELISLARQMQEEKPNDPFGPGIPSFEEPLPDPTTPRPQPTNPTFPPAIGNKPQEMNRLIREIASQLTDDPQQQQAVTSEIERQLQGVPEQVALEVVRDFHADLLDEADPDPETRLETSFDTRILRQLNKAGVPMRTLGRELQNRLRE